MRRRDGAGIDRNDAAGSGSEGCVAQLRTEQPGAARDDNTIQYGASHRVSPLLKCEADATAIPVPL